MAKAAKRAMFISKGRSTEKKYKKYLLGLQKKMYEEIIAEVESLYQKEIKTVAQDASNRKDQSFVELFKKLRKKWYREFYVASKEGSSWFVEMAKKQAKRDVRRKLKQAGYSASPGANLKLGVTTKMQVSEAMKKQMDVIIKENVNLICSIPQKSLNRIQKVTTDSFLKGRDIGGLYEELKKIEGIDEVRAATIARDQTNKATMSFAREEAKSVGITKGRWLHIGGRKSSRKSHAKMNGKIFDLDVGLYDEDVGDYVKPGELILCNCTFQPVIS